MSLLLIVLLFQNSLHFNTDRKSLAIDGFDPVSYFMETGPQQGTEEFQVTYDGVVYYFKNESNKKSFAASPDNYVPEYGGWCAYAMGETGEKVKIDPLTFKIIGGKNNLFYNFRGYNTLTDWDLKESVLLPKAKSNWKSITNSDQ